MSNDFLTVTEITTKIKRIFDTNADLKNVKIKGEVSNFTHHSRGHFYFTLKDNTAQIKAVMFASNARNVKFNPKSGVEVVATGYVSVYEASGSYQIIVSEMQEYGKGNIFVEFEKLKKKLADSGKLSDIHKKPIPKFPNVVGVVTSPTGAAIRDIYNTIGRRFPLAEIHLYPTLVQGVDSKYSVVESIQKANSDARADVLIVGRGGGSIEDLWAFNEEIVAEAIFASQIPIISAVGHETDFTISDMIADKRAATPTAAAEIAVPDKFAILQGLENVNRHLTRSITNKLDRYEKRLLNVNNSYLFESPARLYDRQELKLDNVLTRLQSYNPRKLIEVHSDKIIRLDEMLLLHVKRRLDESNNNFLTLIEKLELLNPLSIMSKGYSIVKKDDALITSVSQILEHDKVDVTLKDGTLEVEVLHKKVK